MGTFGDTFGDALDTHMRAQLPVLPEGYITEEDSFNYITEQDNINSVLTEE